MIKKYAKGGLGFTLISLLGGVAIVILLFTLRSSSPEYQALIQKLVSVAGLGALVIMAVALFTRVDSPPVSQPKRRV